MNIQVLNRQIVENLSLVANLEDYKDTIIISIRDPHIGPVRIEEHPSILDTLRLYFHDISTFDLPLEKNIRIFGNATYIEDSDCVKIFEFVKKYKDKAKNIFVHCEFGHSRSPAVAAAISEFFPDVDERQFFEQPRFNPNMMVYSKLYNYIMENLEK